MIKKDLSLVPFNDLIKEADKRCSSFVAAWQLNEDKDRTQDCGFHYGKGNWMRSCWLTNILNNDVLNNWNGELQTLQRIVQEEDD